MSTANELVPRSEVLALGEQNYLDAHRGRAPPVGALFSG
jgi:hypothetical protein